MKSRTEPRGSRRDQSAGELGEAREVDEPLGRLGARGEQPVAAQADPLDQAADEDVGAHLAPARSAAAR